MNINAVSLIARGWRKENIFSGFYPGQGSSTEGEILHFVLPVQEVISYPLVLTGTHSYTCTTSYFPKEKFEIKVQEETR